MKLIVFFILLNLNFSYANTFKKDEVFLAFKKIDSLITSSKAKYKDDFLFIGKVEKAVVSDKDGSSESELRELAPKNTMLELLISKEDFCYELVQLAFATQRKFEIRKAIVGFFKATPDSPLHDNFLKAKAFKDDGLSQVSCRVF